ncbi:probable long-chain-alcohol O-fatty-acyltransferase 4 [Phoenix dactylifera]|uniref:Probable long-chain-alcohol O-fatty-acyltransferase 4 n=1 Tax=Phoenix dactylifera TaxID=42345 RepID=A0A8B7CGB8_PHODC|nr:probable long-chain-alcohol O-fatty-acyltransferase 4 [Phoenix dactylifera]
MGSESNNMEGDLEILAKVSLWVAASMTYVRFASSKIRPGKLRLLTILPVLPLLLNLPWSFSSIHLRAISAFFLAWLALFKLLLLAFGLGPLSPSLPLFPFLSSASLPIKLLPSSQSKQSSSLSGHRLLFSAVKALLLAAVIKIYRYRDEFPPCLLFSILGFHIYLLLDLVLASAAAPVAIFGLELEPHFDAPFRAASLQDFWGRRWNLVVSAILRPSVYHPVRARCGFDAGVFATFLVSGLMHEVMVYYVTLAAPTGEMMAFFVLHGLCTLAEVRARKAGLWRPNPMVAVPITVGFLSVTAIWLLLSPLLRSGEFEQVLAESVAAVGFLEDAGMALIGRIGLRPK